MDLNDQKLHLVNETYFLEGTPAFYQYKYNINNFYSNHSNNYNIITSNNNTNGGDYTSHDQDYNSEPLNYPTIPNEHFNAANDDNLNHSQDDNQVSNQIDEDPNTSTPPVTDNQPTTNIKRELDQELMKNNQYHQNKKLTSLKIY